VILDGIPKWDEVYAEPCQEFEQGWLHDCADVADIVPKPNLEGSRHEPQCGVWTNSTKIISELLNGRHPPVTSIAEPTSQSFGDGEARKLGSRAERKTIWTS